MKPTLAFRRAIDRLTRRKVELYASRMGIMARRAKLFPGLATATKRLADGSKQQYFYAWRGGPLLKAANGDPLKPGDKGFVEAYSAAQNQAASNAAPTVSK
jgi:hypothetical protein